MNPQDVAHSKIAGKRARICNRLRRDPLGAAGLLIATLLIATPVHAGPTSVEQRIERIRSALLPAVLVQGEPIQSSDLSVQMKEMRVPGVSIAVIHDGKIEWARSFGVVTAGGPPVTAETLFQAASITKPLTALAALRLVQAGKLSLDADVNQHLKSWKLPPNPFIEESPVTLRGLLTHSAGVTVPGFRGYETGSRVPTLFQILDGEPPANSPPIRVDMTPGKMWRYSGGGFLIAEQMMTDVTGTPFATLMQEWVLRPLGMKRSTYTQPLPAELLAQAALAHRADGTVLPGGAHVYPELGAAGLWSTPSDLARYAIAIQEALSRKSNAVLSAQTAQAMLTPAYNQQALGLIVGASPASRAVNRHTSKCVRRSQT